MALYYHAGFDVAQLGTCSVVMGGAVGNGTASITTGTYCHTSLSAITGGHTSFSTAVQTALNAVHGGFTVTFNSTTQRYTIANATMFSLTWTGTAGGYLRRMLGFSGTVSSTTSTTGTLQPYFSMVPTITGRSSFSDIYEPEEVVEEAIADDETPFAVSKQRGSDAFELSDQIMWSDWTQAMEPVESVLIARATTAWTWERFFKHCRGEHPFLVVDGSSSTVHKLRAKGASFSLATRERVAADYDGLWYVKFTTRQLGAL